MTETQKSSSILSAAFLDTIQLAVCEKIRAALKEGGFTFYDRLISVNEGVKRRCQVLNSRVGSGVNYLKAGS